MKISVIMSVYNSEKYLEEAIESILNQTFKDFEFIIVNDNSNDNSAQIIEHYAAADNRIIKINNSKNLGLTKSLNIALNYARGDYIARMDSDDISISDRFKIQLNYFELNKYVDIVGSYAFNVNENNEIISIRTVPQSHNKIEKMLPIVNPMIHPSVMFRRKCIKKLGGYNPENRVVQDYELWFRAFSEGYKFYNIPVELIKYRINNNYHIRKSTQYRLDDFKIRLKGYRLIKLPLYKYIFLIIPIIQVIIPSKLSNLVFKYLKKMDPR